ncbi:hypothetical protein BCR35DRAFT_309689 [Leucosporidium creatinivorum]|uniref:F-box domain-containing protein n=1 Tax=Leucosporidium creatinivorum TaxID=106004 RepID=A0A1Y2DCV2_9BASI|nr:hypothetical protein BCR35DRAFT_309689 [Leucosporidium creatinivorum]
MDVQPAQQPTSTTHTRIQQPADSPAAALPTETLQLILELALEDEEDPFERQRTRRSFSKVCYHCYSVAASPIEYAVSSDSSARKLALKLKQSTSQHGAKVRLLAIQSSRVNGSGTVTLLEACQNVEHLSIELESPRTTRSGGSGAFGHDIYAAMKHLRRIRVLEFLGCAHITRQVVAEMVENRSALQFLRIHATVERPQCVLPWEAPTPSVAALRHLDISGDVELARALLPHLAPFRTTFSLIVRRDPLPDSGVGSLLLPFAPHVHDFAAPDGWLWSSTLRSLLLNMKNVHTLELHHSIIKDAHLVLKLHPLAKLRELIIVGVATSAEDCAGLHVEWLLSHLSPFFERLRLPRQLAQLWTAAETKTVEDRAEQSQFEFVWT